MHDRQTDRAESGRWIQDDYVVVLPRIPEALSELPKSGGNHTLAGRTGCRQLVLDIEKLEATGNKVDIRPGGAMDRIPQIVPRRFQCEVGIQRRLLWNLKMGIEAEQGRRRGLAIAIDHKHPIALDR